MPARITTNVGGASHAFFQYRCSLCPRVLPCQLPRHGSTALLQILPPPPKCMSYFHTFILPTQCDRCHFSATDSGKAPRRGRNVPTAKLTFAAPTSPRRTEVAMDMSYEQYLTPRTDHDVIYIGRERPEQLCDKPRGPSFDDDPGSGVGKYVPE